MGAQFFDSNFMTLSNAIYSFLSGREVATKGLNDFFQKLFSTITSKQGMIDDKKAG